MKLFTDKAQAGRFMVARKVGAELKLIGSTGGFDTYEDAAAHLAKTSPDTLKDELLILQVVSEYRVRSTFVEVHPVTAKD